MAELVCLLCHAKRHNFCGMPDVSNHGDPGRLGHALRLSLIAAVTLGACGDGAVVSPTATVKPGLAVVSGAGATDSVEAILTTHVTVELGDGKGRPRAGRAVSFDGAFEVLSSRPLIQVRNSSSGQFASFAIDTTDARGRASVLVRLGVVAGSATLSISVVGDTTVRAQAAYSVVAGTPARVTLSPRDTVLYAGRTFALSPRATDRHGNVSSTVPQYSVAAGPVSVSASGVVSTLQVGRGVVRAIAGTARDSAFISVPPMGEFTALRPRFLTTDPTLYLAMQLDGSQEISLESAPGFSEADLAWNPNRTEYVFGAGDHDSRLFRSFNGITSPFPPAPVPLQSLAFPRYSRDGAWIYFNGRPGHQNGEIWRARSDGSLVQRIGPQADDFAIDAFPDPSPDGSRLAYATNRVNALQPVIRLIDVGTGTTVNLDVPGVSPRWFPSGNELAYLAVGPSWGYLTGNRIMRGQGQLAVMNADGTNRRLIPTGVTLWQPHFDVSRDGKYLLAVSSTDTLEVIDVATGTTIPLAFARRLHLPHWRD